MGEEKMINQFTFTVLVALAWLSEFLFGTLDPLLVHYTRTQQRKLG